MATPEILKQLRDEEGCIKHAYQDHLGYWTIGVGFLIDERKGGGLYPEEIDFILANRVYRHERLVIARFPWAMRLSKPRLDVLTQMSYQLGLDGLSGFRKFLTFLLAGNYLIASEEMLDSKWAKQTPGRAKRMSDQILTGEYQWRSQ